MPSWFKQHNYVHEGLCCDLLDRVIATGNADAIKIALYAVTLEGVLHQMADHNPPKGMDGYEWCKAYADWAIHPEDTPKPPPNEF